MDHLLDELAACKVKSKMDLTSGFWQVRLSPESKKLTSFILPNQMVYRFKVLPMGLAVSPGVFQHYTSRHVARFKLEPRVREVLAAGSTIDVLVDDFLLGSTNEELHLELLDLWLTYAEANRLFSSASS